MYHLNLTNENVLGFVGLRHELVHVVGLDEAGIDHGKVPCFLSSHEIEGGVLGENAVPILKVGASSVQHVHDVQLFKNSLISLKWLKAKYFHLMK